MISFEDYYYQAYGIKVRAMSQPLIEVITRVEKIRTKDGGMERKE